MEAMEVAVPAFDSIGMLLKSKGGLISVSVAVITTSSIVVCNIYCKVAKWHVLALVNKGNKHGIGHSHSIMRGLL